MPATVSLTAFPTKLENATDTGPPMMVAQRSRVLASVPLDSFAEYSDSRAIARTTRNARRCAVSTESPLSAVSSSSWCTTSRDAASYTCPSATSSSRGE